MAMGEKLKQDHFKVAPIKRSANAAEEEGQEVNDQYLSARPGCAIQYIEPVFKR